MRGTRRRKELTFLDSPENRRRVRMYFYIALVVLFVLDFFVSRVGHLRWEKAPEFFAAYGFVSCIVLIFVAKLLRIIVKRPEDYYENR